MAGKAHHTVQRFHLAQFVGYAPKGHVWIYDNRTGVPRSAIPENVSVENNFYSFERKDGTWDNVLDDWITNVEGKATPVYTKLLEGKIPPYSQDKYDFAQYLALTYVRTRAARRMSAETIGQMMQVRHYAHAENPKVFEAGVARYEKDTGKVLTRKRRPGSNKHYLILHASRWSCLRNEASARSHVLDDLTDIFVRTHWSLVDAGSGFYITSDNPLLRIVPGQPPRRDWGFRHEDDGSNVPAFSAPHARAHARKAAGRTLDCIERERE